ncbi:hypothetical protein BVC71_03640 [Marivivens niveibacter]|uniref:Uncharacterized protein n=1 Tax=Marivivens niveibacter TaxID=1930667 RepID=A0A251X1X1_9RHOB|nr:hypothetical protein [Marivivens niveibacter]OUD10596.1 hypothetical protein BVC71_03640 [Marivivens niveibacter]
MEIAFHIGASCTDEERLLKSLLKNADRYAEHGIVVPRPNRYRRLVRETLNNLNGMLPAADTRDILIDAILEDQEGSRLILSNPDFICVPNRIFEGGEFYSLASAKCATLRDLFPHDKISFYLGIRDPATFIPATLAKSKTDDVNTFLRGAELDSIRWSDVIRRIQENAPGIPITVWCNEDTPFIWAQLIREISGVDPTTRITGGFDLLREIMSPEGMQRFVAYIKDHPPQTETKKRKIISTFLERFAIEEEIIEDIEIPEWDEFVVESLTEAYEADIDVIATMDGVRFIEP